VCTNFFYMYFDSRIPALIIHIFISCRSHRKDKDKKSEWSKNECSQVFTLLHFQKKGKVYEKEM